MPARLLAFIMGNTLIRLPLMIGLAIGTVLAIAGGFYVTYLAVTWVGN